jgi:hypothetical protein
MSATKIELTPEQTKTLKLFSYYCRGYGAKEVARDFWFRNGNEDWSDHTWTSPQLRTSIESYSSIDDLIETIIDKYKLYYMGNDSDNLITVTFDLNCINNIMSIYAYEEVYEYVDSGTESDSNEDNDLLLFFNEMKDQNITTGTVDFSGGGDSGYINGEISLDNGSSQVLPDNIDRFLYNMLESHQGGWEIDDGSQGTFTFDFKNDVVILDFQLNTIETYRVDTEYEIRF